MKVEVNGKSAGTKELGCALCGATWGSFYQIVENTNLFFCCDLCATAFTLTVKEIKTTAGLDTVEEISIRGNYSDGRTFLCRRTGKAFAFFVRYTPDAEIEIFKPLEASEKDL